MAKIYKNTRSEALPSLMHLPAELQTDIFSRLPTTSLLTCKRVCKPFRTLIQNPDFKLSRSITTADTSHSLILQFIERKIHEIDHTSHVLASIDDTTKDEIFCTPLIPLVPYVGMLFLIGSCNGLVCFAVRTYTYVDDILLLWNPVTEQSRYIPIPDINEYNHQRTMEFYFVPETNDYNIISIGFIGKKYDEIHVAVYRMSTNSWKLVDRTRVIGRCNFVENSTGFCQREQGTSVFLNGCFHWIFSSTNFSHIVSFNLKDEELGRVITMVNHNYCIPFGVRIIDESVTLLCRSSNTRDKICIDKGYDWAQHSRFLKDKIGRLQGCWRNILILSDPDCLYFYDTNHPEMMKKLISLPPEDSCLSGFSSFS